MFCFPWKHISSCWKEENILQHGQKRGSWWYLLLCSYELTGSDLCYQKFYVGIFWVLWAAYFVASSTWVLPPTFWTKCLLYSCRRLKRTELMWWIPLHCVGINTLWWWLAGGIICMLMVLIYHWWFSFSWNVQTLCIWCRMFIWGFLYYKVWQVVVSLTFLYGNRSFLDEENAPVRKWIFFPFLGGQKCAHVWSISWEFVSANKLWRFCFSTTWLF